MTPTAPTHPPTAPITPLAPTCDTDGCTHPAEIGLRLTRTGREFALCEPDARRSYDALDYNRRGGRVEFFDL